MQRGVSSHTVTLATTLERDRLGRRERQLELVVRELRARARTYARVPPGLAHAIKGFEGELDGVRRLLHPPG